MQWTDSFRSDLDLAMNEAEVVGLRLASDASWCDVLLHVVALDADGAIDRDPRRVLRLRDPTQVDVLLRRDTLDGLGPPIPLADLAAVEEFFAGLSASEAMYGWRFFDYEHGTEDWPSELSLSLGLREASSPHTFWWFNECGQGRGESFARYCIEGRVSFERLDVMRADGTALKVAQFVADAERWWSAFRSHDPALSVEAQQEAGRSATYWRPLTRSSALVPGLDDSG